MTENRIYVMTGATSGMGLRMADHLGRQAGTRLIVGARSPAAANGLKRAVPADRLTLLELDLCRLASVAAFCDRVRADLSGGATIDAIACNAGLQVLSPRQMTEDRVEATFAANHLGHFALVHRLLDTLRPGAVVLTTGSGTHDPSDRLARRFGFRGGLFPDAEVVARGELDRGASAAQQGKDRYATSKLCNILFVKEMARRIPARQVKFVAFDPGLMPGTGLARDRSALARLGWTYLLPALRRVAAGVSSPEGSARAYAQLLQSRAERFGSGAYVDFHLREIVSSSDAMREDLARDLYRVSARLAGLNPVGFREHAAEQVAMKQ